MNISLLKTLLLLALPVAIYAQAVSHIPARRISLNINFERNFGDPFSSGNNSSSNVTEMSTEQIRHIGTICARSDLKSRNKPLIFLDGRVIRYRKFQHLKPDDIESFVVVRGEKAITEYGSTAENGVLIITTKPISVNKLKGRLN